MDKGKRCGYQTNGTWQSTKHDIEQQMDGSTNVSGELTVELLLHAERDALRHDTLLFVPNSSSCTSELGAGCSGEAEPRGICLTPSTSSGLEAVGLADRNGLNFARGR